MRPLTVELEGIGSFRDPTVVELAGVDLFVLSGPTGAGKTTILDAIVLALYGSVPRYDDRRLVAPIVNQGANEGRVRLTFRVGERTFTATRVVRRTKHGATTKEARLEETSGGGSVVRAGTADELTAAVADLLGLTFEQFCRSVVLPQGAFDRFLFAKPAERADLLMQLLDLGVHEEVGKRARALATDATARADAAARRLQGDLAGADAAARERAEARVTTLTELADRCGRAQEELDRLREEGVELRGAADAAAGDRDALAALHRPDDVDALADASRAAADAHDRAAQVRARAADAVEEAEQGRAALPDAEVVAALARSAEDLRVAEDALPALAEAAADAGADAERAAAIEGEATAAVEEARRDLDGARRRELLHAITEGLHAGDDCPVCGTTLVDDPGRGEGAATATAEAAVASAAGQLERAAAERREADRRAATATERADAARDRRDAARRAVADARDAAGVADDEQARELAARVRAADETVATARTAERDARRAEAEAAGALQGARQREAAAWEAFDRARDGVARLGPPAAGRDDLATAWDELLAWAEAAHPTAVAAADEAAAAVLAARERYREADRRLREDCAGAGVEVPSETRPGVAVADALGTARTRAATLAQRLDEVARVTRERDEARAEAQVADHLGRLLRADGFERWLLARALTSLVEGAAALLRELTSGAYSLDLDPTNQFLVVDHRNADEPRTVRSLSGGERFLASLALALALAEHVAELAADGAARLDSLFLDEGFGTLDPDTLDVVAAALEELGARGRVVGVVTHVRDLADRLPVRFEVRRGPGGSRVWRADLGLDAPPGDPAAGRGVERGDAAADPDDDEEVA